MKVFLDLEETVIDSWDSGLLINITKVKTWLSSLGIKEVSVFSAAIWNDSDKNAFNNHLKIPLEEALEVKILDWVSMEEVWRSTSWKAVTFDSVCEMISLIGKKRMFEDWCMLENRGIHNVLLDDSFGNWRIEHRDSFTVIEIVDVNSI